MDPLDPGGKKDLQGPEGHLEEGDQDLQVQPGQVDFQADWGHRDRQGLKDLLAFLALLVLPDLQASLELFLMAVEMLCALLSVLQAPLDFQGCQDSRVTQVTKVTKESLERMDQRETQVPQVHLASQELLACRVLEG